MKKFILIFTMLLTFIDQIAKYLVINNLELYKSIKVIPNFFYITFAKNDGAAFSILSGGRWFFIAIGVIALVLIIRYIFIDTKISKFDVASYSLVVSGILGNLIDRIVYGYVVDYMDFYIYKYNAPIFNFADMCIVIGAFMVLYSLTIRGDRIENTNSRWHFMWYKNR